MMAYGMDTVDRYVELGGGYCPECENDDPRVVGAKRVQRPEDGSITIHMKCEACNAQWEDRYILDHVTCVEAGKHHNQNDMFQNTG